MNNTRTAHRGAGEKQMEIRQALLAVADHIEWHPSEFDFDSCETPSAPGCGTPACAMGWLACFLGVYQSNWGVVQAKLGANSCEFYMRMDEMSGGAKPRADDFRPYIPGAWRKSASVCASTLRQYADKYHACDSAVAS